MEINPETIKTIVSYLGAIGIGSVVTMVINNYFLSKENKKKLLFEARVKAYSGLVSRFFNLFNELDINRLSEALRFVKINELLSEAYLLGSREFVEMLGKFKPNLLAFHRELDEVVCNKKKDESLAMSLHKDLLDNIGLIYNQMRADLFIEGVEIETLKIDSASVDAFKLRGLSAEEISQRHSKSVEEALNVQKITKEIQAENQVNSGPEAEEQVFIEESNYRNILPQIEVKALNKLASSINKDISREVAFAELPLKFDGVVIDNDAKLIRLFEVKIFPNLPKNKHGKVMTFVIVESLRKTIGPVISTIAEYFKTRDVKIGWKHIFTVAVVLNTKNDFIKIRRHVEDLKEEFMKLGEEGNVEVNFVFYNLKNMQLDLD